MDISVICERRKNREIMACANREGQDYPVHPHSLIGPSLYVDKV